MFLSAEKMTDGEEEKDLVRTCHKLQIQIWEMEVSHFDPFVQITKVNFCLTICQYEFHA